MNEQQQLIAVGQEQLTSDDYYTPRWVFDALALRFDLDVSAPPGGVAWIPADRFYTMENDGLAQPWTGRVWMNPPFSAPAPWVRRFIAHQHGVALVPFAKSAWFFDLWNAADAMCAPGVEMSRFVGGPIFMPCALAAFGPECVEALSRVGVVRVRSQ